MTIEKLDLSSPDLVQGNIEKIQALFPNVVTEGPDGLSIDFDALRQELSDTIVEGPQERYRLDWPGKRAAMLAANTPISKTLRPVREDSVDFDTTQNLFIEGDNLDALKLLQDSYLGKVKMIYIDPPYNTGKDFIYKDNFTQDKSEYLEESGQVDEDGGRLVANPESNGRYHSDWLSMMYPRLKLARNLLRDDGVIFISIDDNEYDNLRGLCDSIFGPDNFIEAFIWHKKTAPNNVVVGSVHEYILMFAKNKELAKLYLLPRSPEKDKQYKNPDNDPRGRWKPDNLTAAAKGGRLAPSLYYELVNPNTGKKHLPPEGRMWAVNQSDMDAKIQDKSIYWGKSGDGRPMNKRFLKETRDGMVASTLLSDVGSNSSASKYLSNYFDGKVVFETPKPVELLERFGNIAVTENDIALDFFAGSGAMQEALFKLNLAKRSCACISVQLPELASEDSDTYKAGFSNIADLSKERIRRAGAKILADNPDQVGKLDVGFRVLKIDSSNMKDVHTDPRELKQGELLDSVSHIKPDRSGEDLLFQVMLNQGIELSQSITRETVEGKTVYIVGQDNLIACFDDNISDDVVKNIAGRKPLYAIFRDESFKEPADKINAAQIFKQLTEGHTRMKVI